MTTKSAKCMDETVCVNMDGWKEERQARSESEKLFRTSSVRASEQRGGKESLIHKFQWYYTILALICAPTSHIGSSSPFRHTYVCVCLYACVRVSVCVYGELACAHVYIFYQIYIHAICCVSSITIGEPNISHFLIIFC